MLLGALGGARRH